jgi:Zn-finger nucleic acid-binding protein
MRCPVDNETLVMADRSGVEIDYCPKCRGVWLDRGELDKIIERAMSDTPATAPRVQPASSAPTSPPPVYQAPPQQAQAPRGRYHDDDDDDEYRRGYRKKRKESFLSDLFDF